MSTRSVTRPYFEWLPADANGSQFAGALSRCSSRSNENTLINYANGLIQMVDLEKMIAATKAAPKATDTKSAGLEVAAKALENVRTLAKGLLDRSGAASSVAK